MTVNGGKVNAESGRESKVIGGGWSGDSTVELKDGTIIQQPTGRLNGNHTGHNWDSGQTDGCKTEYICTYTGCRATKTVFGHHMVDGVGNAAPTCTKTGVQKTHCEDCNFEKEVIVAIDPEAHTWDNGVVTTEPTYTTEGVKTYTCTGCGVKKTESIAKLEPEENSTESAALVPMGMTDQFGAPIAYEQSVENGRVVFAAPAENAVLTGSLAALAELKAQGAEVLVFRTPLKETELNIDWLLAQGSADDVFALAHKGTEVSLTVAGRMVRL